MATFDRVLYVTTIDGKTTKHEYYREYDDKSNAMDEAEELTERIVHGVAQKVPIIYFDNPSVAYNSAHVIRIEVESEEYPMEDYMVYPPNRPPEYTIIGDPPA